MPPELVGPTLSPGMPPVERWLICKTKDSSGFCSKLSYNCGPETAALPTNVCGAGAAAPAMSPLEAGAACR